MKILAIESSCDETAVAVVERQDDSVKVLASVITSSQEMHAKTGGIIPENAAREQVKSIVPVIGEAIENSQLAAEQIEAIAVTVGPGLIGSLLVGVETAKTLSYLWKKPVMAVNHLVGHIYAAWLKPQVPEFPLLALVVSGGHTDLVRMETHGWVKWIGGTRDDAAGECFDKCARLLGLPYPGGPAIALAAEKYCKRSGSRKQRLDLFPRPMMAEDNYDFSFSGLKTAVFNKVRGRKLSMQEVERLAAEVQEAIVEVLVTKTARAVEQYKPKAMVLAGGVAANALLRDKFASRFSSQARSPSLHVPEPRLCTDNAAMIGAAAIFNPEVADWQELLSRPELAIDSLGIGRAR